MDLSGRPPAAFAGCWVFGSSSWIVVAVRVYAEPAGQGWGSGSGTAGKPVLRQSSIDSALADAVEGAISDDDGLDTGGRTCGPGTRWLHRFGNIGVASASGRRWFRQHPGIEAGCDAFLIKRFRISDGQEISATASGLYEIAFGGCHSTVALCSGLDQGLVDPEPW